MKKVFIILAILSPLFLSACAPKISNVTWGEYYKEFYENQPTSVLVLPARNTTTAADAANLFRYSITRPLAERGFYVFPVHLVDAFFKSENMVDDQLIRNIPIEKLKKVFNADAIVYIDINAWDTGYTVATSNVDVGLSYSIVDANTGKEVWANNAYAYSFAGLDTNNGLLGLVVSAVATAINTATDYTQLSYVANNAGMSSLPAGKYSPEFNKDQGRIISFRDLAKIDGGRLKVDKYFVFGENEDEEVALVVKDHVKGFFGFSVRNIGSDFFKHNGYPHYYYQQVVSGKNILKNRFFQYDNGRPFLFVEGKKVFVETKTDGTIPYVKDGWSYYLNISDVVDVAKN
jgi:hypothetical protein